MSAALMLIFLVALGQNEPPRQPAAEEKAEAAARLEFMKQSASVYDVTVGEKKTPLRLVAEPVLRWTNPVSNIPDGVLFLWIDAAGRPQVAAQVFIAAGTKDLWLHEFSSLSAEPFDVARDGSVPWHPRKPGLEMEPVADAPAPADSAVRRLTQMRNIALEFQASDDFEGKSRWELRLLSKPLHRWGKPGSQVLDGALFAFAHGTDPEVFVLVEARGSEGKYSYEYGLAPMTAYALKVSLKGREIWTAPYRKAPFQPNEPFFILKYVP